jgi:hypothetical protein
MSKFASQRSSKLTRATMKDRLFPTIFGTIGLYNIIHFVGLNMLYPMCFDISQNLAFFHLHQIYKFE